MIGEHSGAAKWLSAALLCGLIWSRGLAGDGSLAAAPEASPALHKSRLPLLAAVDAAIAQHPSVAAAAAANAAAAAGVGEARAALYPTFRLSGTATQYQEPALVTPLHGFVPGDLPPFDTTVFQGSLGAGYTLFDGGSRGSRIEFARQQAGASAAAESAATSDITALTIDAYLRVLTASQVLAAQAERLQALGSELVRARQFLAAGRAATVELLRAEATQAAATAERVRLLSTLDVAERDLARLVAFQVDSVRAARLLPVALADTTLPDRTAVLAQARMTSPALVAARAQLAAAAAATGVARGPRWPELRLFGNYTGWSDDEDHQALEWNAGAALAYPFFTGGAVGSGIERAQAAERGAAQSLRLAELQLERQVDLALARCAQAHARVQSLSTAVQRFAEVARIENLSLAAGSGTQTDYLRSEADLLDARAGWAEARHGEVSAHAELARVAGILDRAWIARSLENEP